MHLIGKEVGNRFIPFFRIIFIKADKIKKTAGFIKEGNYMSMAEQFMVDFLKKFDEHPFVLKVKDKEYHIGTGKTEFIVKLKKMCIRDRYIAGRISGSLWRQTVLNPAVTGILPK